MCDARFRLLEDFWSPCVTTDFLMYYRRAVDASTKDLVLLASATNIPFCITRRGQLRRFTPTVGFHSFPSMPPPRQRLRRLTLHWSMTGPRRDPRCGGRRAWVRRTRSRRWTLMECCFPDPGMPQGVGQPSGLAAQLEVDDDDRGVAQLGSVVPIIRGSVDEAREDGEGFQPQRRRGRITEATSLRHSLLHGQKSCHCDICEEDVLLRKASRRRLATPSRRRFFGLGNDGSRKLELGAPQWPFFGWHGDTRYPRLGHWVRCCVSGWAPDCRAFHDGVYTSLGATGHASSSPTGPCPHLAHSRGTAEKRYRGVTGQIGDAMGACSVVAGGASLRLVARGLPLPCQDP